MTINLNSNSPNDTRKIGQKTGKFLQGNELILLHGDLGSGKTEFTKGLSQSLDLDPQEVVSPTFTLVNFYQGKYNLYHLDLYRLGNNCLNNLPEIDDYLYDSIIVVEWAQYLDQSYIQLKNVINVYLTIIGDAKRSIMLKTPLDYLKF